MFDKRWLNTKIGTIGNVVQSRRLFDDFVSEFGIHASDATELLELDEKHRRTLDDLEKVQYKIKQINKEHMELRLSLGISYDDWIKEHCKKESECSPDEEYAGLRSKIYAYIDIMQPLLGQEIGLLDINEKQSWYLIQFMKDNIHIINEEDLCELQKKQQ